MNVSHHSSVIVGCISCIPCLLQHRRHNWNHSLPWFTAAALQAFGQFQGAGDHRCGAAAGVLCPHGHRGVRWCLGGVTMGDN